MIDITLINSSAVVTDAQPWTITAGDPFMPVILDRIGAGTSA